MLKYFPTPYPDENWYSMVCRYFVRSGYDKFQTAYKELFLSSRVNVSFCFASPSLCKVMDRLPQDLFNKMDIVMKATLYPYITRFSSKDMADKMLSYLLYGDNPSVAGNIKQWENRHPYFRYCPICAYEEKLKYNELYWHNSHQIQLMPLCPLHRCRLENSLVEKNKANKSRLIPASIDNCPQVKADHDIGLWEERLTDIIYALLYDNQGAASEGRSALLNALYDNGLLSIATGKMTGDLLWDEMAKYYGQDLLGQIFDRKWFNTILYRMLISASCTGIEKYALLGAFLDIDPQVLTGNKKAKESRLEQKMRELSKAGIVMSKKEVAEQLHVRSHQMDAIARRLGIEPFWTQTSKGKSRREPQLFIKAYVTQEEKEQIEERSRQAGAASVSEYVKYCIRKEMKGECPSA